MVSIRNDDVGKGLIRAIVFYFPPPPIYNADNLDCDASTVISKKEFFANNNKIEANK